MYRFFLLFCFLFSFEAHAADTFRQLGGEVKADATHDGYLSSSDWSVFMANDPGTVNSVTGTAPILVADPTGSPVVSITPATTSGNGYLSSTDWNTFNTKVGTSRSISTTAPLTGGGDLTANRTFAITQAATAANGYLTSTDWNTFNNKQSTLSASDASHNGYLTSGDWSTFNAKQVSTLPQYDVWAGNSSNVAQATNTVLLGDVKAGSNFQTVTIAITGQAAVTATAHGLSEGDKVYFTTTGALPTGITASTTYFAHPNNADHTQLATSISNLHDAIYLDTSGTQSGVHTMYSGGLVLKSLSAASFDQIGLTSNAKTLTLKWKELAANDYTWRLPNAAPVAGQVLGVADTTGSPSIVLGWANSVGVPWTVPSVVCIAIGVNFFNDDFSADGGSCNANFGGVAYGYGTGPSGTFGQGDRILFVNTTNDVDFRYDGVYYADNGGSVIRAPEADTADEINGGLVTVVNDALGSVYDHSVWMQTARITTVDTTPQLWQKVQSAPAKSSPTASGVCAIGSTTLSTTATNLTCTGIPASSGVSVTCSGASAFSTPTGDAVYCRATGTINQIACNTVVANITAMTFACSWVQP